jgi:hypothetical protein
METLSEIIDSSVKSLGEVESLISRSVFVRNFFVMNQFSNPHFIFFTQYISHSITKKFPTETLLEITDSSVRSSEEVKYGNQICLQHQKTPVRRKIRNEVYHLLPLYINRSIKKNVSNENTF